MFVSFPSTTMSCTTLTDGVLCRWTRYVGRNRGAGPHDVKRATHVREGAVRGCSAGTKEPSMYTMLQEWTDFGAGWERRPGNDEIPPGASESIYVARTWSFDLPFLPVRKG